MGKIDTNLKMPETFDAQKLANKKVMGVDVLDSSQKAQVLKGGEGIKTAQKSIKSAQIEVNEADDEIERGLSAEGDVNSEAASAKSNSESISAEDLYNDTEAFAQSGNVAKAKTDEFAEIGDTIDADFETYQSETVEKMSEVEALNQELADSATEMEAITAEIAELAETTGTSSEQSPVSDGMGGVVDAAFDGTGSGVKSAYSLATASDVDGSNSAQAQGGRNASRAKSANVQPHQPQNAPAAQVAGNTTPVSTDSTTGGNNNSEKIEELKNRYETIVSNYSTKSTTVTTTLDEISVANDEKLVNIQASQETAEALVEEGETQDKSLIEAQKVFATANEYGGYTSTAGRATELLGVGLVGSGTALNASGGSLTATGTFTAGIGAVLTSIGAPLCALFGIGTPITAAGGTTAGVGGSLEGSGATLCGAGASLTTSGKTTEKVGKVISEVGKGVTIAANAGLTTTQAVQGDWKGAVSSGLNVVASSLSFAGSVGEMAGTIGDATKGLAEAQKAIEVATAAFGTSLAAAEGNVDGIVAGGLSIIGSGASFAGGNNQVGRIIGAAADFAKSGYGMYTTGRDGGDAMAWVSSSLSMASSTLNLAEASGADTSFNINYKGTKYETDENGNVVRDENYRRSSVKDENGHTVKEDKTQKAKASNIIDGVSSAVNTGYSIYNKSTKKTNDETPKEETTSNNEPFNYQVDSSDLASIMNKYRRK